MVLPLILGAVALGAGAFGVSKGVEGTSAMGEAQDKVKRAQERYERRKKRLDSRVDFVNTEAKLYGMRQKDIKETVFVRVARLIEEIGKRAKVDVYEVLDGVDINIPTVGPCEKHKVEAVSVFNGLLVAAGASVLASTATTGGVTMLATASTGAAISGLSGAAANSALLAALGGGSLAAGGGGMALGSLVLGGVTFAPILAVGGLAVAAEGEKALTKATKIECDANKLIAEMELRESVLDGVFQRLNELSGILNELKDRALASLSSLEKMVSMDRFDGKNVEHMERLRCLLLIISSLAQIMKTPILGEDGAINPKIDVVIKQVAV
ncbi:MAG: hypothetical protein FJ077_10795 [Cyanobacteria bacterium K_DeepCast_35m_m2_023]|nr:hypothetical protein [Cyanobacteria bacterium K_DeepCast_35m_m2_023]